MRNSWGGEMLALQVVTITLGRSSELVAVIPLVIQGHLFHGGRLAEFFLQKTLQ